MASEQATAGVAEHLRERPAGPAVAVEIAEGALLAVVLFLTALSQRFRFPRVRLGIICLAFGVLAFSVYVLATVDTALSASAA